MKRSKNFTIVQLNKLEIIPENPEESTKTQLYSPKSIHSSQHSPATKRYAISPHGKPGQKTPLGHERDRRKSHSVHTHHSNLKVTKLQANIYDTRPSGSADNVHDTVLCPRARVSIGATHRRTPGHQTRAAITRLNGAPRSTGAICVRPGLRRVATTRKKAARRGAAIA